MFIYFRKLFVYDYSGATQMMLDDGLELVLLLGYLRSV